MITMTVSSHTLVPIRKSQNNENKFCEIKCLGFIHDYIHNEYCQNKKQMIYKEEYIVFESSDFF